MAVEAARRAAELIRAQAGRTARERIWEKGVHDLVTEVDEASQQLIIEHLSRSFPDYEFLAEEGTDLDGMQPEVDGYRWIVDPIDGTTNFAHGVPPYAVSIALQHRGEVVLGVILDVAHDELFTAVRGEGAFLNGSPIRVSRTQALSASLLTTGFPYRAFDHLDRYLEVLREFMRTARGVRRPGSAAVDLAYVACGRFDGFFETGLLPWDVAAGIVIVEEAGGRVTDYRERGTPLFQQQILASNGLLHEAMLDVLRSMRDVTS